MRDKRLLDAANLSHERERCMRNKMKHERETELSRSMHLFGADLDFDGEASGRLQRRVHLYSLFLTPHILVCVVRPRVLVGPSRKDVTSRKDVSVELIRCQQVSKSVVCRYVWSCNTRSAQHTYLHTCC